MVLFLLLRVLYRKLNSVDSNMKKITKLLSAYMQLFCMQNIRMVKNKNHSLYTWFEFVTQVILLDPENQVSWLTRFNHEKLQHKGQIRAVLYLSKTIILIVIENAII